MAQVDSLLFEQEQTEGSPFFSVVSCFTGVSVAAQPRRKTVPDRDQGSTASRRVDGVIVGNVYDKYTTHNPVARRLVRGFLTAVTELYERVSPRTVLEVGCGEGYLAQHLLSTSSRPERFEACDLSVEYVIDGMDPLAQFREASVYDLPYADDEFDLVVCCEVLEHLTDPADGLEQLARVARHAVLFSTPREPVWRILNLLRGRYLTALGNTPGHVQHFSRRALIQLCQKRLHLLEQRTPIPWTLLLGKPIA